MPQMFRPFMLAVASSLLVAGCSTTSPDVVSRQQAQRMQSLRSGTIESVRPVQVDGQQSGVGAVAGAAVGGIAGSGIGGHREAAVGGVLVGIAGAMLGNAIERSATREDAVELVIRLDDGTRTAVVQAKGAQSFYPGDRVDLVTNGSTTRVVRAH